MTFFEAAITVLRAAGRPLHYKKITEVAIRKGLLSHVGKTPEFTMGTRLNQEIRKDEAGSALIRTRPGVFGLRAWTDPTASAELVRETVSLSSTGAPLAPPEIEVDTADVADLQDEGAEGVEGADADASLPGEGVEATRRRRRRRRRRVGAEGIEDEGSSGDGDGDGEGELEQEALPGAGVGAVEGPPVVVESSSPVSAPVQPPVERASSASAPSVVGGPSLVEAVERLLRERFDDPDGVAEARLAEAISIEGDGALGEVEWSQRLRVALLADNAARHQRREAPRFEHNGRGSWRLAHWAFGEGARTALEALNVHARALQGEAERAVEGWLGTLPAEGLGQLMDLWGESPGQARVTRLLCSAEGVLVRLVAGGLWGGERALWLALDGASGDERLASVVGSLGAAPRSVVFMSDGAQRRWASAAAAWGFAPGERAALAQSLIAAGIGVRRYEVSVIVEDAAFFLTLGAPE